jgi:hypothetical protein
VLNTAQQLGSAIGVAVIGVLFGALVGPRPATLTGHRVYPNGFALMRWRWSP